MNRVVTRRVVLAGAGLVGLSTAATSAVSLYELAVICGIPEPFSAALPIALDVGAAVAAIVWITERGELRVWGRAIAIAALAGTVVGNGVQHALTAGLIAPTLPLVLTVGAAIPAMLWCIAHLLALMTATAQAGHRSTARTAVETPPKRSQPAPTPRAGPPSPTDEVAARRERDRIRKRVQRANNRAADSG